MGSFIAAHDRGGSYLVYNAMTDGDEVSGWSARGRRAPGQHCMVKARGQRVRCENMERNEEALASVFWYRETARTANAGQSV